MPRVATDPTAYADALTAARADAAPATIVHAQELARAIGATWRIVEGWIHRDPDFPVRRRGGQGTPWQFDLIPVLDHLIARAEALTAARRARKADVSRLAGFGGGEAASPLAADPPAGPGAAAAEVADRGAEARGLKALAEARMQIHKLKVLQGEYVRRDRVEALLADLMATMQAETLAVSAKRDPGGLWPPEVRVAVDEEQRNVLVTVRDKLDAALTDWARGAGA